MIFTDQFQTNQTFDAEAFKALLLQRSDEAFYHLALFPSYKPGVGEVGNEVSLKDLITQDSEPSRDSPPYSRPGPNQPPTSVNGAEVVFVLKAANDRGIVNPNLIHDLELCSVAMKAKIEVTTAKTGHVHLGSLSRHFVGNAVDIALINDTAVNTNNPRGSMLGDRLVLELQKLGYVHTPSESGNDRVCIWRSDGHFNHVHVSNRLR